MQFIGVIPARYGSTRLPGKPLALIGEQTVIEHVYRRARHVFDQVVVATDDHRIVEAVEAFGGVAVMTSPDHPSGTDRVLEAFHLSGVAADVVVNIQGDEPFISLDSLRSLMSLFEQQPETQIGTAIYPFAAHTTYEELSNPNAVKVVVDSMGRALYFSRNVIPHLREVSPTAYATTHTFYKHIGLYAYLAEVLEAITRLPQSSLERAERLEQLRWLEHGYRIDTVVVGEVGMGIDTPQDLERAKRYWAEIKAHD